MTQLEDTHDTCQHNFTNRTLVNKMATSEDRSRPNILITGTPGTGKTCTSELVSEMIGFKHLNVGSLVGSLLFFFYIETRSTILLSKTTRCI